MDFLIRLRFIQAMSSDRPSITPELVAVPSGDGWRVRILSEGRLQFIEGFDTKSSAEEWIRAAASDWIAKVAAFKERL